jgi:uncharacterized protein (UPF0248 family)
MVSFDKEVLEKDALYRIMWDKKLKPGDYSLVYLDCGNLKEVKFADIKLDGDFFHVEDAVVPMHRVRRILEKGKVVWEKRRN